MTGYLQRLAQRALGISRPARAMPVTPFAPAPPLVGEIDEQVPFESVHRPPAPTVMPRTTTGQAFGEASGEQPSRAPAAAGLVNGRAHTVPSPGQPGASREQAAWASGHAPLETIAAGGDSPAPMQMPPNPRSDVGVPHAVAETLPRQPTAHATVSSALDATVSRRQAPRRAAPALTPMLLQPAPQMPPAFHSGGSVFDRPVTPRAGVGAVEETTEVHVHIGRIEMTAVHEPAPLKPAAARRPAPTSLDEYLAKRHGGRS